jgi:MOSC domain-containing protein YiiM
MTAPPSGRLVGIASRPARRAPMQERTQGTISMTAGLEGDHKGTKFPRRAIAVLSREAWEEALAALATAAGKPVEIPWTARRANLLVEGVRLPRALGGIVRIGPVRLEITYPTQPCRRMEEVHPGLLAALHPDWRGGITCRVLDGGEIRCGDAVVVEHAPPEKRVRLPD